VKYFTYVLANTIFNVSAPKVFTQDFHNITVPDIAQQIKLPTTIKIKTGKKWVKIWANFFSSQGSRGSLKVHKMASIYI